MIIEGTCGKQIVNSLDELLHPLRTCRDGEFGEFWLGEEDSPALVIHTNGDLAYLHYFPASEHPGFQSVGDTHIDGLVTFKQEGQGDFSVPRACVVTVAQAFQAATEFFASTSLPGCIQWTEL